MNFRNSTHLIIGLRIRLDIGTLITKANLRNHSEQLLVVEDLEYYT